MANMFKFGVTKEDREKEQAEKQRRLEAEVQERTFERDTKLNRYVKIQKRNKIIVTTLFIFFSLALLTFGTYNTFFKQPLTVGEVKTIAQQTVPTNYDQSGIFGYLYNNMDILLSNYLAKGGEGVESYTIEKDTLRVVKVNPTSNTYAQVDFEIDIKVKAPDSETKDKEGNKVKVTGETTYKTYKFSLILGRGQNPQEGAPKNQKIYYCASKIRLISNDTDEILVSSLDPKLAFVDEFGEELDTIDANTSAKIQNEVETIFMNLYSGRDVSLQFTPNKNFKSTTDKFKGITSFSMFEKPNAYGFNSYVEYSVETEQGLTYKNSAYLTIEQDGTSYKITAFY